MNAPDPRPQLTATLDQVDLLLTDLKHDQAGLPTPCEEFDVAALVGHLRGVVARLGVVLSGRHFAEAPSQLSSDGDPVDWLANFRALRAETEAILADDAVLGREVVVPWGRVPGAVAVGGYVGELTVHAWDLARAIGRDGDLDPALAEAALPIYQRVLPPELPRGNDVPFGAVVEVGADAGPYERLVAWTGRDPYWSA